MTKNTNTQKLATYVKPFWLPLHGKQLGAGRVEDNRLAEIQLQQLNHAASKMDRLVTDSLVIAQMSGLSDSPIDAMELHYEAVGMLDTDYEKTLCDSVIAKATKLAVSNNTEYHPGRFPDVAYRGGDLTTDIIGREFAFVLRSAAERFPEMCEVYKAFEDLKVNSTAHDVFNPDAIYSAITPQEEVRCRIDDSLITQYKPQFLWDVPGLDIYVAIKVCVLCLRSPTVSNLSIRDAILWGYKYTAALQTLLGEMETRAQGFVLTQAEWDEFNADLFKPRMVWAILS